MAADDISPTSTAYELHLALLETIAEALITGLVAGLLTGVLAGAFAGWPVGAVVGPACAVLAAWWVFRTVPRRARERSPGNA